MSRARSDTNPGRIHLSRWRLVILLCLLSSPWWGAMVASWGLKRLAIRAVAARQPDDALRWLRIARRYSDDDGEIEFLLARSYRKQGRDYEAFREHIDRARELGFEQETLDREQILAHAQAGQMWIAEPHLARLCMDHRGDALEIYEAYSLGQATQGEFSSILFDGWVVDFPDDPLPYILRGRHRVTRSEWALAEEDFRRALALDPDSAEALCALGSVMVELGRLEEAIACFDQVPDNSDLQFAAGIGCARCLRMTGDYDGAMLRLQSLPITPEENGQVALEMGQIQLQQGRHADAVQWLECARTLEPQNGSIRYALAVSLQGAGRTESASEHFQWLHDYDAAMNRMELLKDAVKRDPRDVAARVEIGRICMDYGMSEEGIRWAQGALNFEPGYAPALQLIRESLGK